MIIGHQKQWDFLSRIAASKKIPHALLFSGPEKLGKKTIAFEFLSLILGKDSRRHPDLILVEPLPLENEIQIAQIRDLNWRLSLKPYSAFYKTAILDRAHLMNKESQDCFLKTLEEPKGESVLILITEYPEALAPTILSRCEVIRFNQLEEKEIENYFKEKGLAEAEAKILSRASQGRPGVALDFLSNPQKIKEREEMIGELVKLKNSSLSFRFQYAKKISEKDNLKEILSIWLSYFRQELIGQLDFQGNGFSFKKIKDILTEIQATISLLATANSNPRLALEILLMKF